MGGLKDTDQPHPEETYSEIGLSKKRKALIDFFVSGGIIIDNRVEKAFRSVERHKFIPGELVHQIQNPYKDSPIHITETSSLSQPRVVAQITQFLRVEENHKVLEVGTGLGYQAAILGFLASEVYTVEIDRELANCAKNILGRLPCENVIVIQGDGELGLPEHEPYDRIVFSAGVKTIHPEVIDQLSEEGVLVAPVGPHCSQSLIVVRKSKKGIQIENVGDVLFVELVHSEPQIGLDVNCPI